VSFKTKIIIQLRVLARPQYWTHRLIEQSVPHQPLERRFDEPFPAFTDLDGLLVSSLGKLVRPYSAASNGLWRRCRAISQYSDLLRLLDG
jgi:hypothetical protein